LARFFHSFSSSSRAVEKIYEMTSFVPSKSKRKRTSSTALPHRVAQFRFVLGVKHQKSAAARA
jgi:hypothetical protein